MIHFSGIGGVVAEAERVLCGVWSKEEGMEHAAPLDVGTNGQ